MADPGPRYGHLQHTATADGGVRTWPMATDENELGPKVRNVQMHHDGQHFQATSWSHEAVALAARGTHFGYVHSESMTLRCGAGEFALKSGMYFCVPGRATLEGRGSGHVTSQFGYGGLFQIGGPIETTGRLAYIDGCSDTLLISPVVRGEACLNLLCLPPYTRQSAHTHPSFRCGLVASGHGECRTSAGSLHLSPGTAFSIEPSALHSFHTADESMRVIAFHPDSDYGPWHDDHPMVNRTMINGTAAARLSLDERRIADTQLQTERKA